MSATCQTCVEAQRRGYCAPFRCYCGHADCYAFASYVPRSTPNLIEFKPRKPKQNAWADREVSTWIDKL